MKLSYSCPVLILLLISVLCPFRLTYAQEAKNPIVKNFGGVYDISNAVYPDTSSDYKIVIDLKTMNRDKESINPGLNNVARMMNLHGLGGIGKEDLNVVVIAHGGATEAILTNEAYYKRYELDNPNLALIGELKKAGASIYVCGQSLLAREYSQEEVNDEVTIGLSMLTVFTEHINKSFIPLIFD